MKKTIAVSISILVLFAFLLTACTGTEPAVSGTESPAVSAADPSGDAGSSAAENSLTSDASPDPASGTEEPTDDERISERFLEAVQSANNLYASTFANEHIDLSVRPEFLESEDWAPLFDSIQGPYTDIEMQYADFVYFLRSCDKKLYHQQRYVNTVYEDALMLYLVNPREDWEADPLVDCVKTATDLLDEWRTFLKETFERLHAGGEWKLNNDSGDQIDSYSISDAETGEVLSCYKDQDSRTIVSYGKYDGTKEDLFVKVFAGYPSEKLLLVTDEESVPYIAFEEFHDSVLALSGSFRGVKQAQ